MRTLAESIAHWDVVFLTRIIRLEGKKLFSTLVPTISHSGDGYFYPFVPLVIYMVAPEKALLFLHAGLIAYALELPLYKLVKNLIKRDRPCEVFSNVHKRVTAGDRFSFPSGHTAAAVVMAVLIANFFPLLAVPAFAWALLVGFSRIYLGVHYPTDILAGLVIGLICGHCGLGIGG